MARTKLYMHLGTGWAALLDDYIMPSHGREVGRCLQKLRVSLPPCDADIPERDG